MEKRPSIIAASEKIGADNVESIQKYINAISGEPLELPESLKELLSSWMVLLGHSDEQVRLEARDALELHSEGTEELDAPLLLLLREYSDSQLFS